jgi:cyclomaltodextrinase / maltogenic alpha-amylase / neopullulanase
VNRVASTLRNPDHLVPLYALLFTAPGVPSLYYGSEWGMEGERARHSDQALRPALRSPEAAGSAPRPYLAEVITRLARVRHATPALRRGGYEQLHVAAEQIAFARRLDGERVIVAVNMADAPAVVEVAAPVSDGTAFVDLLDPSCRFIATRGRLRIDTVERCWARILVPQ